MMKKIFATIVVLFGVTGLFAVVAIDGNITENNATQLEGNVTDANATYNPTTRVGTDGGEL